MRHPQAETPLTVWFALVSRAQWSGPADVKAIFGASVDFVADNRIIFDIAGNKYRLIVHVAYPYGRVLIKFVGTHKDYDRIQPGDCVMENIRPIRTEADYEWALAEVTRYFEHEPQPGSPEADRFDVLSTLIEAYESAHFPIAAPDPVAAIAAYMEMHGLKQSALAAVLDSRSRASEILNRRRALTMDMAHRIHRAWNIPAEILLQPYHLVHPGRDAA